MKVLVTGGAGYIGTHACVELLKQGYQIVVVDNFSNSSFVALERVARIADVKISTSFSKSADFMFFNIDIRNQEALNNIFKKHKIGSVIHFAGSKSVSESIEKPLNYYDNNVIGSIVLFNVMQEHNVKKIIFSSSATIYGDPETVPIDENFPVGNVNNSYGQSKYIVEKILQDMYKSDHSWRIALLRYFNPVGAHESGIIGESPNGVPNNLMPYICQVATGQLDKLRIFGGDYPTKDGTGVRDYVHVVDLSLGHISALNYLNTNQGGVHIFNIGTGSGNSVLDVVRAFERSCGMKIPYNITDRRPGDVSECWSSTKKANFMLRWRAKYDLQRMCDDSWRWQSNNKNGYK